MSKKNKKSSGKKPAKVIKSNKSSKKSAPKKKVVKKVKPAAKKKTKPVAKKSARPAAKKVAPKTARKKEAAKPARPAEKKITPKTKPEKKAPPVVKADLKKAVPVPVKDKQEVKKAETKPLSKTEQKIQAKNIAKAQEKAKAFIEAKEKAGKLALLDDDHKPANEPPGKFELEYVIHSSAELLFTFLTEPSGLSEWFCDDVNIRHGIYTFFWDGSQQQAKELKNIPERLLRFQWIEKNDGSYFEFRIERDELTGDISLIITDFAETPEEKNSSKLLWDSQIDKLLHVMGAYF